MYYIIFKNKKIDRTIKNSVHFKFYKTPATVNNIKTITPGAPNIPAANAVKIFNGTTTIPVMLITTKIINPTKALHIKLIIVLTPTCNTNFAINNTITAAIINET